MELITNTIFINLEHRTDRLEHVSEEFKKINIHEKMNIQRFNAIKTNSGNIGCTLSHIKCLEIAKKEGWSHLLIVEDDIKFLNPQLFQSQLNKFLSNHSLWDVILIAGNNIPPYQEIDDTCIKVASCQTTTGYIVY
jgi:glycosyl transferase family 25